jgi:hypothetical protein
MPAKQKYPIFISYAHKDYHVANTIFHEISDAKLGVWFDQQRLNVGERWNDEIKTALDEARTIVVVVTKASNASLYVTYEWSYAMGQGKRIIGVLKEDVPDLHPILKNIHMLDYKTIEHKYHDLIDELKKPVPPKKRTKSTTSDRGDELFGTLETLYTKAQRNGLPIQTHDILIRLKNLGLLDTKQQEKLLALDRGDS